MHFFAFDCAILCHADNHTGCTTAPNMGTFRKHMPPYNTGRFLGWYPGRRNINRTTALKKQKRNTHGSRPTQQEHAAFYFFI